MVKVGDEVRFIPTAFAGNMAGFGEELKKPVVGKIVYIHPRHHWCRVEWTVPRDGGINHECFDMEEIKKYVKN